MPADPDDEQKYKVTWQWFLSLAIQSSVPGMILNHGRRGHFARFSLKTHGCVFLWQLSGIEMV